MLMIYAIYNAMNNSYVNDWRFDHLHEHRGQTRMTIFSDPAHRSYRKNQANPGGNSTWEKHIIIYIIIYF